MAWQLLLTAVGFLSLLLEMLLMLKLLTTLTLLMVSCRESTGMEATEGPSTSMQAAATASTRQFRVFDPNYDYAPGDRFSAQAIASRFPVHEASTTEVAVLKPGAEFYAARMQLLDQATISVRIQTFLFTADESGYEVANKLLELHRRGVKVKIIVDPVTNIGINEQRLYYNLRRAGITIEGYEFLYLNFVASFFQRTSLGASITELNNRYHEKYFIVDAEDPAKARAIAGGSNIANAYFRVEHETTNLMWTDCDIIVRGDLVADMLRTFEENFTEFSARKVALGLGVLAQAWDHLNDQLELAAIKTPNKFRQPIIDRLRAIAATPVEFQWQHADARFIQSRPRHQEDLIHPAYVDFIDSSKTSVDIVNAFFVPDADLIAAIGRAVARGVHVRIVTNSVNSLDFVKSSVVLVAASRATYADILKLNANATNGGKVELFEWGADLALHNGEGQVHAKFAIFDNKAVVVGSYNMDPRGRNLNSEHIIAAESPALAEPLVAEFESFVGPRVTIPVTEAQAASYAEPQAKRDSYVLKIANVLTPYL